MTKSLIENRNTRNIPKHNKGNIQRNNNKFPSLLVRAYTFIATLEINMEISQKIRKLSTSRSRNTTFGYICKGS